MFVIYDLITDEFLSDINHLGWADFGFDNHYDVKKNSKGFVVEIKGYFYGEFDAAKASFESKEAALKFAEKLSESFVKDGWSVNFAIASIEVEEEVRKRGEKVIESKQFATVEYVDFFHREVFQDEDEITELEETLGKLIPENFHPNFVKNAEYIAARKIINALAEMGYEITKKGN